MTGASHSLAKGASKKGRERRRDQTAGEGEIKGPGPFRSVSLVVLKNFRDLDFDPGPGFQGFPQDINGLSGTNVEGRTR
jgi:hypothetical protein